MYIRIAAATGAALLLMGVVGAPTTPVMLGAALAYGWLLWKAIASR